MSRSRTAVFGLALGALACAGDAPLFGARNEPAVFVVLSREGFASPADSALYGLVVTASGPFANTYLSPLSYEIRRTPDDSLLDVIFLPRSGTVPEGVNAEVTSADANVTLPWTPAAGRLGRRDLVGGDVFELSLSLADRVVSGRTRIPLRPTPVVMEAGDSVTVHWPRDAAAAGYRLLLDTEGCCLPVPQLVTTTDTSIRLHFSKPVGSWPTPAYVRVMALDSAYFAYVTSNTVTQAGVTGALGVFGAWSSDSVEIAIVMIPSVAQTLQRK